MNIKLSWEIFEQIKRTGLLSPILIKHSWVTFVISSASDLQTNGSNTYNLEGEFNGIFIYVDPNIF